MRPFGSITAGDRHSPGFSPIAAADHWRALLARSIHLSTEREKYAVDESSRPRLRLGLTLGVIAGALALDVGSLNVINAALPVIGSDFELDSSTLQWVMASYSVTFAGFILLSGRMADVLGRRLIFAVGVGLFTAAALVGMLAPNVAVLIIARAVQGIGAALSGPAALALLSELFPEGSQRNRAFGVYAAVGSVSASAGLVLGGLLTQFLGWRSVFAISVAFGVLVTVAIKSALPASIRRPTSLDLPGAGAVTAGLILVVFGVSRAGDVGWSDPEVIAELVIAIALLVAFVVRERRTTEPLMPLAIFRFASVRAGSLTATFSYTVVVSLLFFGPLYMQEMLGYTPLESALAVLPLSIAVFFIANYFTGRLLVKFGQRTMLITGLVLVSLGIGLWLSTSLTSHYWLQILPGVVLIGVGMGLAFPAMTAAALTEVPQEQHGLAGAINVVAQQIGASVGLVVLVVVAAATATSSDNAGKLAGYHVAYAISGSLCIVCALIIAVSPGWEGQQETYS